MARPSKPHLVRGKWRTRIKGVTHYLGEDRRQAFAKFHRLIARDAEGPPSDRPETINGAVDRWLILNTAPTNGQYIKRFVSYAGCEFLDNVSRDLLTRYHLHLKQQHGKRNTYDRTTKTWSIGDTDKLLSDWTIKHYVSAATSVLRWAHDEGWLPTMPKLPKLSKPMRKNRDLDTETVSSMTESMTGRAERAGTILRFILTTGCRPSEACRLRWADVHLERRVCILTDHKTAEKSGRPKTIYLNDEAINILQDTAHRMNIGTGSVFINNQGRAYTSRGLRSIMRRHTDGKTPYQLRHTFAQTASESGVRLDVLSKLLGHNGTRSTGFYYEVRDDAAMEAVKGVTFARKTAKVG